MEDLKNAIVKGDLISTSVILKTYVYTQEQLKELTDIAHEYVLVNNNGFRIYTELTEAIMVASKRNYSESTEFIMCVHTIEKRDVTLGLTVCTTADLEDEVKEASLNTLAKLINNIIETISNKKDCFTSVDMLNLVTENKGGASISITLGMAIKLVIEYKDKYKIVIDDEGVSVTNL